MDSKDYVMRVIHQFIDRLLKILKLREEGKFEQALDEIEAACQSCLGLNPRIIELAPDSTLLSLLTIGKKLDADKSLFLAKLLNQQAQIFEAEKEDSKSYWSYTRSLRLYVESLIVQSDLRSADNMAEVDQVLSRLAGRTLSPELNSRLAAYRNEIGRIVAEARS